jgi:prepilin-type N-terminal cleavage/methylation domain-containing protein
MACRVQLLGFVQRRKAAEAGFTLIEMMVVVVVIAVLAAIAIPLFTGEANEQKNETEVQSMFTALGLAEQQYKLENGVYLSTGATEADTWPATPGPSPQNLTPLPATWASLKIALPQQTSRCGYVVIAGPGGAVGARATGFGFSAPTTNWYYVLAHCDADRDASIDGYFFASSVDPKVKELNPEH